MSKQLYYDSIVQGVFVVRQILKTTVHVSEPCRFANDARTNVNQFSIRRTYFNGCYPIDENSDLFMDHRFDTCDYTSRVLKTGDPERYVISPVSVYGNKNYKYLKEKKHA